MSQPKVILLKSSDGEIFEVNEEVVIQSKTIKHLIKDTDSSNPIPIPNVKGQVMAKVIEYCKKHVAENHVGDALKEFDKDFVNVEHRMLYDLIKAADYLHIKDLSNLTCETMAYVIHNKTTEEIREILNIKNDYTPEEEAEVRGNNAWAFE